MRPVIPCRARKLATAFGVSPFGSTDTAMICALEAVFGAHQVLRDAQVRGDQRADVGAVRVEERDEHRLAPVGVDVDGLAEVVLAAAAAAPAERASAARRRRGVPGSPAALRGGRCPRRSRRSSPAPRRRRSARARRAPPARESRVRALASCRRTYQRPAGPRSTLGSRPPRRQISLQSFRCNANCRDLC